MSGSAPGSSHDAARQALEADVLRRVEPSLDERREMETATHDLLSAAQGALEEAGRLGVASVQGSVAKDTWLAGSTDVDVFLLMGPTTSEQALHEAARQVGRRVLDDAVERYAQHPYVVGRFRGLEVDMVPAYRVEQASQRMSAVDRTPFHTEWVREHLDGRGRAEVRLAKAWCKGVDVYGADTARAGFSGYLIEVLLASLGSFAGFISWLAGDAHPRRLALGDDAVAEDAPLVVPDPIDPARNCAAAVSTATLERAVVAARAYIAAPDERFFFPTPPRSEPADVLQEALQTRGETWLGLWLPEAAQRLDIVFPQFQKAAARIAAGLEEEGFSVLATQAWTDDRSVGLQWRLSDVPLPSTRSHRGPPAESPHADRFLQKWQGHPDAVSPVRPEAGRLQVEVAVRERTPAAWLAARLGDLPLGKHVEAALGEGRLEADPAGVVPAWSPAVADFILRRRPWER